jgi:hypothetical protein
MRPDLNLTLLNRAVRGWIPRHYIVSTRPTANWSSPLLIMEKKKKEPEMKTKNEMFPLCVMPLAQLQRGGVGKWAQPLALDKPRRCLLVLTGLTRTFHPHDIIDRSCPKLNFLFSTRAILSVRSATLLRTGGCSPPLPTPWEKASLLY